MRSVMLLLLFSVFISVTFFPTGAHGAYTWSDRTITIGYQSISNYSVFLYDEDLVASVNARFPGLDLPIDCLTFNASLYRLSTGLRPVKKNAALGPLPDPIGIEYGFFVPPNRFVFYHRIFGRHLTIPRGEYGELVISFGDDNTQPFQLLEYTYGTQVLTTNEDVISFTAFVGMGDVLYGTGIFARFSNGHVRANSMTSIEPINIVNASDFMCECVYGAKFDANANVFRHDSYTWPFW